MFLSRPQDAKLTLTPEGALDARVWSVGGRHVLIVVNTTRRPQLMATRVPKLKAGAPVEVLFEDRALKAGKELVDVFAPLAVHVYQW